jgi:hypothetical protein
MTISTAPREGEPVKATRILVLICALFLSTALPACGGGDSASEVKATDYSKAEHWLSAPTSGDKPVDVFYLYPTAWQKTDANDPNICEVDNPIMLKYAGLAFDRQATAFETVGNIYAPYYRQADAAYTLALPLAEQDAVLQGIPETDAFAAFEYYIEHYNNGRPFILAGHSQGSNVLVYLLSKYMKDNPKVYEQMVAAYVIGYSVTGEYLAQNPHLKFAEGPDDTGVIISYNTEAPGVEGANPVILPGGSVVLKADGTPVLDVQGNLAPVMDYADARVDTARGALICSTADVATLSPGSAVFPRGVFHSFDYPFYFFDIRENAANRVEHFLSND